MTNNELSHIFWNSIVIQTSPGGERYLGLICQTHEAAFSLMNIIKNNSFRVSTDVDLPAGSRKMMVDFPDMEDRIALSFSAISPALQEFEKGHIKFISTGFVNEKGRIICFSCSIDIEESDFH